MVLSHAKLKRKRKEEVAEGIVSGATAVPETSASAMNGPSEAVKEGKKEGKKKKKKGKKKQKTNDAPEVEATVVVESSEAVEEGKKRKLTGNKKQRTNDAAEVEALTAWEAVRAEEVKALKEKKKEKKMEKKMEKKEKKRNIREALEEAHSQGPLVGPVENGDNHVDNRTDETVSNGGAKTEQPVVENDGVAAAVSERPMSVREKKGKKKKGAKDRWGAKIADDVQEEHPVETVAEKESPPTSTSAGELYESKKVVVGGMPYTTTEDDIHAYFYECGVISELDCMIFPDTGNFRGIAFITFETEEGAANALKYDGENMGGRFLKIDMCKVKPRASVKDPERGEVQKTAGSTSAYIGNLSWDITEDTIKSFFKKSYGNSKIDSVRLSFDKDTGEFKGFGHIDFGNDESLEAAIKLNQTPLLGRPLKIAYAVPPKGGSRSKNSANGNDSSETRRVGTCYTCGEEGHKAFVCPKRDANGNDKSEIRKVGACYNCGEEGHKSFLCPKKVPK